MRKLSMLTTHDADGAQWNEDNWNANVNESERGQSSARTNTDTNT